jgi:hypothetical protein
MQQHHVGVLGVDAVEGFPDAPVIVAVDAVLRDNLDENGGANQSFKRRPAAKV